jgi:peroxiredoxin
MAYADTQANDITMPAGSDNSMERSHMAETNSTTQADGTQRPSATTVLSAGTTAPEFKLRSTPDRTVALSQLRGRPVVLAFYPADWSPVCGDQMALYNEILPEVAEHGAHVLGISVDGVWCHKAFTEARMLHFDLLAEF